MTIKDVEVKLIAVLVQGRLRSIQRMRLLNIRDAFMLNIWQFTSVFMAKGAGPIDMQAVFTTLSLTAFINYGAAYKILSV